MSNKTTSAAGINSGYYTYDNTFIATSTTLDTQSIKTTQDVLDEIQEIREMLLMLNRDKHLEKKYPKLKEAADEYKRILEKYKTFEILKGTEE